MHAGLDDQLQQRVVVDCTHIIRRISLDIGVDEVAHVRLERLDVQLLAGMALDRRPYLGEERRFVIQRGDLTCCITSFVKMLGDGRKGAQIGRHLLIEGNAQRFGVM